MLQFAAQHPGPRKPFPDNIDWSNKSSKWFPQLALEFFLGAALLCPEHQSHITVIL